MGNANAYIGTWEFVIQENLAAFMVNSDYAENAVKIDRGGDVATRGDKMTR